MISMVENGNNKSAGPPKSFMTIGPTLHYSYPNVHRFWLLTVAVYLVACFIWTRMVGGSAFTLNLADAFQPALWDLGRIVEHPLSIYEYPWQILILGAVMGLLATIPLLVAQLLSFRYSLPLILAVIVVARLGLFGLFVFVSCIAVACRPLRFRSRFISLALCLSPAMIYWGVFGGNGSSDPIRWGFSYAPWIYAWIVGLFLAGIILGFGHYTRYKPGLIWSASCVVLLITVLVFNQTTGFSELDYQLYVAGNNPEEQEEFRPHSLSPHLDAIIRDETLGSYLTGVFYPTEPILLREKLKSEIQNMLLYNRWPLWFQQNMPDEFKFPEKRDKLLGQYDRFINTWPASRRLPIAMYYRALLSEYHPDIRHLGQTETLRFYSNYPFFDNLLFWRELLLKFPQSPESLEARWRIAVQEAGRGNFTRAAEMCDVALKFLQDTMADRTDTRPGNEGLLAAFQRPPQTAITPLHLQELNLRLHELRRLLASDNQGDSEASRQRLARFVLLNPYSLNYDQQLNELLAEMKEDDPLRDNVLLARAGFIADTRLRAKTLQELSETCRGKDGGIQALYRLGMLKVKEWKETQSDSPQRKEILQEARRTLSRFLETYPDSFYTDPVRQMLSSLPQSE